VGKGEVLRHGSGVAILAYGSMVYPALAAAEILEKEGIDPTVTNARFVKPLDEELITSAARNHEHLITVEEAYLAGGFGSAVMELLEEKRLLEQTNVERMGVPDVIVTHGDPKLLLSHYGLNAEGIAKKIRETRSGAGQDNKKPRLKAVK
jgi:1-deoxy-D-xylulose-5-phosphate synthase